jgi:hypothetical protein
MAEYFKDGLVTGGTDRFSNEGVYLEFFHVPTNSSIKFKAFLTNYNETFDTSFDAQEVYGRMDPITIYKGTKRTIALGWDLVAETEMEAYTNLQRVQDYIQMMYPRFNTYDYGKGRDKYSVSIVGAPPLVKIKFVNMIVNSNKARFRNVESELDTERNLNSVGVGRSRRRAGITPFGDESGDKILSDLYLQRSDKFNLNIDGVKLPVTATPKQYSKLIKFGYIHGTAKTHGLLAAPGSLTVEHNIPEDGALLRSINCGAAVLPLRISLASTYTILHEHDLGQTDKFNPRLIRGRRVVRGNGTRQKRFKHFPYGADSAVNRTKK